MNYNTVKSETDKQIWQMIVNHAGQTFRTIRGLEFTYTIKQNKAGTLLGEMVIDRKEKTITRNTVLLAYEKGQELMESEGCVTALSSPVFFALPSLGLCGVFTAYSECSFLVF